MDVSKEFLEPADRLSILAREHRVLVVFVVSFVPWCKAHH